MRIQQVPMAMLISIPLLAGCAPKTVAPIGPGATYQPDEKEQRIWQVCERDSKILQSKGVLREDPALDEYVNSVLARLLKPDKAAYRPLTARVYVIETPVVNAFALPQGDIFLHSAILGRIRSEAQLAMLLGHEITHSTHRHAYQACEDTYARTATASYVTVLSTVGGGNVAKMVSGLSSLVTLAGISGYSRDREREADTGGLTLMAQAGYDPAEGAAFFQNILDAANKKDLRYNALYATHPKMKERLEDCTELAKERLPTLPANATDKGVDRYINTASALIYEDIERQIARGKYAIAESSVVFLLENRPDDATAHAYKGEICRARNTGNDLTHAREAYARAIELDANQAVALRGMGFLCLKGGSKDEAIKYLRAYVSSAPDATDAAFVRQTISNLESR